MLDPLEFEKRPLMARLQRYRLAARFILMWERGIAAFWRTDCWIGLFAGLWLIGIPSMAGKYGEITTLLIFLGGFIYLMRNSLRAFCWPDGAEADRRVEQAGNLRDRPLAMIDDTLANPCRENTRLLWKNSQEKAFGQVRHLRLPLPQPLLAKMDPAGLRIFVVLLLIVGMTVAGPLWAEKLKTGLFPFSINRAGSVSDNIVLWITPPEYTMLGQTVIRGGGHAENTITIPAGSSIKARVKGGVGTPEIVMKKKRIKLSRIDGKFWGGETEVAPAEKIIIRQLFFPRLRIPMKYAADKPPSIALKEAPKPLEKGAVQFTLSVRDDYGVRDLTMRMTIDPEAGEAPLGTDVTETRAVMSDPGKEKDLQPVYDLTWHPWAGLPVAITFEATDFLKQTARSEPVKIVLPERAFHHPVATRLIDIRKRLAWTPLSTIPNAVYELEEILADPAQYNYDAVVTLSLRSMASRMNFSPTEETTHRIIEQLWDTALRVEDGKLTLAARDLRKAQQALEKLLSDPNATDEQIAAAMEKLQLAMAQYMRELFTEMQKKIAEGGMAPPDFNPEMFENNMNVRDLAEFLEQMRAQALSGDRNAARQMLSHLQQMMDSLDPSRSMDMPPQMKKMMETMKQLQDLVERQQTLLNNTRRQDDSLKERGWRESPEYPEFVPDGEDSAKKWGQGNMPPPPDAKRMPGIKDRDSPPPVNTQTEKREQDDIREMLGDMMLDADEEMGKIPENLQESEQEMRGSGNRLGENRPDRSIPHQEKALEHLRQSQQNMAQKLSEMMKQITLMSFGMGPVDPLGRPLSEGNGPSLLPGSKVKIPDEAERKRAQEILRILRKRAGELDRPDYELEYYRRLMKQF